MGVFTPGFRCRCRSISMGTNGSRASWRPTAFVTPNTRMHFCGSDMARAQKFADRFANLNWPKILSKYAKLVTPQMQDILQDCSHYWVTAQSELSTDILFRSRQGLSELYPELLSHGTL